MKQQIEYINPDTGEIEKHEALLPNALPARVTNKCEALYKATVTTDGNNKKAEMNDPFQAVKQVKEEVMEYLLENWIQIDIGLDQITGNSQNQVVAMYEEDLYGVSKKKDEDSKNGQNNTTEDGAKAKE